METEESASTGKEQTALFTLNEARVLACLMEKELTVPDNYPLSLNSLTLACNQKSNREPKMQLPEGEVGHLAKTLETRGFVSIEYGERVHKFEHKARKSLTLDKRQQSLLTVMMLRTPQTLNDLKVRTKRMATFEDNDDILLTLESLNEREEPMMLQLPKGAGQREDRYTHLLCGEVELNSTSITPSFTPAEDVSNLEAMQAEIDALIERVERLEAQQT